jgi:hypothetical protein
MTKDAYDWYETQKLGLGGEFLHELDGVYHKLESHPEYFSKVKKEFPSGCIEKISICNCI